LKIDLEIALNKIQTQASLLVHKDNIILKANDKIDEFKNKLTDKNYQTDKLQKNVFDLQNSLSKETFERNILEGKCKQFEDWIKIHKTEIDRLNMIVITLKKNNATLAN